MRLRYWTALAVIASVGLTLTVREGQQAQAPVASPDTPSDGSQDQPSAMGDEAPQHATGPDRARPEKEQTAQPSEAEDSRWSRAVGPGESLDLLLAEAGLDVATRTEVSEALGSEFDLRRLQPGHRLALELTPDGLPQNATLEVDDGVNIQAVFGAEPSVRVLPPALETVAQAAETAIGSSIYAALEEAGIPTRFATDLALVFAGTLDLRRALVGGEHLRVSWREARLEDRVIGEPMIDFAELDLGADRYEVVWPQDDDKTTRLFKDGHLILAFDQPIRGARLSSAFGLRKHPIHGNVRMHSGVDYAAATGASVHATQSGRIAFMGRRSGYGLMVEIAHAQDIQTVYAHLSAVNDTLEVGQQIAAGQDIGRVGSTGTSTAPHLHYEVIVEGQAVPPLTDTRLSRIADQPPDPRNASAAIEEARDHLSRLLATN